MAQRKSNPDWEQRRYEIAKEICVKSFSGFKIKIDIGKVYTNEHLVAEHMRLCVEYADEFIKAMQGGYDRATDEQGE